MQKYFEWFAFLGVFALLWVGCSQDLPDLNGLPCGSQLKCGQQYQCINGICRPLEWVSETTPEKGDEPRPDIESFAEPTRDQSEPSKEPQQDGGKPEEPVVKEPPAVEESVVERVCTPGQNESCYSGPAATRNLGECKDGTRECQSNGTWGACSGEVLPTSELCDGKDNNCDGNIDETFTTLGRSCSAGVGACKASGKVICDPNDSKKVTCNAVQGRPTKEVCDGLDNDCDGTADDGLRKITYYRDADRDGFGNPKLSKTDCKQPSGYVANNTDCYDSNANANPKQTSYFSVHRGDNSFDYNCDGRAEQQPFKCSSTGCSGKTWSGSAPSCGKPGTVVTCKKVFTSCTKNPSGARVQVCR